MANEIKTAVLGMPIGTATARLRKSLLFDFARRLGLLGCYRCSKPIESEDDFTIEHKTAWLRSDDPVENFFNLDNIAFSHPFCNMAAASRPNKKYADLREQKREGFKRYYAKNADEWNARRRERRRIVE